MVSAPPSGCRDEGLLGPDAVLAHATWLDETEIAAIGSTSTAVVHCPMSNQYVPYGVMPMRRLLDAGATVGLGTDGSTCGHRQDLFENMKMLVLMHRLADLDPGASSAAEALRTLPLWAGRTRSGWTPVAWYPAPLRM